MEGQSDYRGDKLTVTAFEHVIIVWVVNKLPHLSINDGPARRFARYYWQTVDLIKYGISCWVIQTFRLLPYELCTTFHNSMVEETSHGYINQRGKVLHRGIPGIFGYGVGELDEPEIGFPTSFKLGGRGKTPRYLIQSVTKKFALF